MDEIVIEPVGGFVGAGGPSHLKSEGRIAVSALSAADRARVEALFAHPQPTPGNFGYRLTRQGTAGTRTVNVPPDAVPAALIASIQSTLQ